MAQKVLLFTVGVILAIVSFVLLNGSTSLGRGSGLWLLGLAALAVGQATRTNRSGDSQTSQWAAFKALLAFTLVTAGVGVVALIVGVSEEAGEQRGEAMGFAILMLGFAGLLAMPTWFAFKKRKSTESWGINGP